MQSLVSDKGTAYRLVACHSQITWVFLPGMGEGLSLVLVAGEPHKGGDVLTLCGLSPRCPPTVVDKGANLEMVIRSCVFACVGTAGQRCTSGRRLVGGGACCTTQTHPHLPVARSVH